MLDRLHEKEIITDLKQGRREAWISLFNAYSLKLWQRSRFFFNSDQPANEITRETFIKAAKQKDKLSDDDCLWSFLWKIASESIKKEYHRKFRQQRAQLAAQSIFPQSNKIEFFKPKEQSGSMVKRELCEVVRFTLATQSATHQSIILGKFLESLTIRHISKEVGLHGEKLRNEQEFAVKKFKKSFKILTNAQILPDAQKDFSEAFSVLLEISDHRDQPADNMLMDMSLSASLEAFADGPDKDSETNPVNARFRIAILALLVIALIATIAFMKIKTNHRKLESSSRIKKENRSAQTQETKKADTKTPAQQINDKETTAIEETFSKATSLAQDNNIAGLIKLLDSNEILEKMIAARFLAIIGDASALASLKRESDNWIGESESNIFAAAIEKINGRIQREKLLFINELGNNAKTSLLRGKLIDEQTNKVQAANVMIYSYSLDSSGKKQIDHKLEKKLASNEDGVFEIEVVAQDKTQRKSTLVVKHPDYGIYYHNLDEADLKDIFIMLPHSAKINGKVEDEFGNPIAKAKISVEIFFEGETLNRSLSQAIPITQTSDENGLFEFTNLPLGCIATFFVTSDSFSDFSVKKEFTAQDNSLEIVLNKEQSLRSVLVNEKGESVSGFVQFWQSELLETNDKGRFKINLANSDFLAGFAYSQDKTLSTSFATDVDNVAGNAVWKIVLTEAISLSGYALDQDALAITDARFRILFKKPNAQIVISPWNLWLESYDKTSGHFELKGIPAGLPLELYIENATTSKAIPLENIQSGQHLDIGEIVLRNDEF